MFTYRVPIGDWSHDGHGQCDYYTVEVTHDSKAMQKAYKEAVAKCNVSLEDGTRAKHQLCVHYEDSKIDVEARHLLTELGVQWKPEEKANKEDGAVNATSKDMVVLLMEMIRTQLEGFEYKFGKDPTTFMIGRSHIGYGCFWG